MAKHSKSLALQGFAYRYRDRKSEETNKTLFLCSVKQHGHAHPQSALQMKNERKEREREWEREKEREGERAGNE